MMKRKYRKVPKIIRSEKSGEYTGKELWNSLKTNGIKTQLTVPNTSRLNGVSEHKNRTLIKMTRCFLASSGLLKQNWGRPVSTANHVLDRLLITDVKYELYIRRTSSGMPINQT